VYTVLLTEQQRSGPKVPNSTAQFSSIILLCATKIQYIKRMACTLGYRLEHYRLCMYRLEQHSLCRWYRLEQYSLYLWYRFEQHSVCLWYSLAQHNLCIWYRLEQHSLCIWYRLEQKSLCLQYMLHVIQVRTAQPVIQVRTT
jgi:hypothetical protein